MKDIKELIFAAVEENAVQFQELANEILHARAYEAIEALRPEVAASMFGEAKEMEDDEEGEDEDEKDDDDKDEKKSEKKSEVDEELKGNQHKIDKNKNGKIDAHDFKLLRKEEVELDEQEFKNEKIVAKKVGRANDKADYASHIAKSRRGLWDKGVHSTAAKTSKDADKAHSDVKKTAVSAFVKLRKGGGKVRTEETNIQEVAPPKNQADWQALINHQIKVTGHPVATDAQFRAPHGKDMSKIASLEPGEDKAQYAKAQGGNVKL